MVRPGTGPVPAPPNCPPPVRRMPVLQVMNWVRQARQPTVPLELNKKVQAFTPQVGNAAVRGPPCRGMVGSRISAPTIMAEKSRRPVEVMYVACVNGQCRDKGLNGVGSPWLPNNGTGRGKGNNCGTTENVGHVWGNVGMWGTRKWEGL